MKSSAVVVFLVALLLPIAHLDASVVRYLTLQTLTELADRVVVGHVREQWVDVDAESRRVYTYSEIEISENLKGDEATRLIVRQFGGTLGGREWRVAGMPILKKDTNVVLFLRKHNDFHLLRGLGQGLFEIVDENGEPIAIQRADGMSVAEKEGTSGKLAIRTAQGLRLELSALKAKIRAALAASHSEGGE